LKPQRPRIHWIRGRLVLIQDVADLLGKVLQGGNRHIYFGRGVEDTEADPDRSQGRSAHRLVCQGGALQACPDGDVPVRIQEKTDLFGRPSGHGDRNDRQVIRTQGGRMGLAVTWDWR